MAELEWDREIANIVDELQQTTRVLRAQRLHKSDCFKRLNKLQEFLAEKVKEYHSRRRLEFLYDPAATSWLSIHRILAAAEEDGKAGAVAQYLVGAKLALRFADADIANERFSSADAPTKRFGDFELGDTIFHVTMAPSPALYEKCRRNLDAGRRVYLLVPDAMLIGARQNAEAATPGRVAVTSIECFVANNIEEMSIFAKAKLISGFRRLLDTYNQRVDEVETDKSLLIEIPETL